MRHIPLILLPLVACDGASNSEVTALRAQVDALEARVAELETARTALEAQATSNSDRLDAADPTLAAADDLLAVVSINGDGDVAFSGVNVLVQSGAGTTDAAPNGKGNLIVGYNEPETDGMCVGGTSPGMPCTAMTICPGGGTCNLTVLSDRTGSHNLVVGVQHAYSSYGSIIGGEHNDASAPSSLLAGADNTCSGSHSIAFGTGHAVSAQYGSALGGLNGTINASWGTVAGGTACSVDHERSVCLGGTSNASTATSEVFP